MQPGDEPAAELWLGAHEQDSSRLIDGTRLCDVIREQPIAMLGGQTTATFGPRLPYLLKVLAAAEPLSLQVHPPSERAQLGFAAEEAAGIPRDAPHRRYRDASHKPELIYALTRFEGMAGFRDIHKTSEILRLLQLGWADELAMRLARHVDASQGLREVVSELLALPADVVRERLMSLAVAAEAAERASHRADARMRPRSVDRSSVERESRRLFAQTPALCRRYPDDPGVLVTLLLNHVVLASGEAMFLEAGVVHAYTSGFGVEIMASSDNVVRAGLTQKHVDRDELLRITNFTPIPAPLFLASRGSEDDVEFRPPVTEFALRIARTPVVDLPEAGPRIVLVLEGTVTVRTESDCMQFVSGESVFVAASEGLISTSGQGRVAVASIPAGG